MSTTGVAGPLRDLGVTNPVIAAPMAGGPSTVAVVAAAASADALGFLAGGYKSAEALATQIAEVRTSTDAFGVNVFVPNPVPVDRPAFRRYASEIQPVAEIFGLDVTVAEPVEDDDGWTDKIDLLLESPVPVVSFTFGVPAAAIVAALRRAGTLTVQTVTSVDEAELGTSAGVDLLAVQSSSAGGHRGMLHPDRLADETPLPSLVAAVRQRTSLPVLAAGGVSTAAGVAAALRTGASGVMVGTVLLRCSESGASAVHQAAIAGGHRDTVVTRAFTGRPARGLRNEFIDRFEAAAPLGYPALHHLTSGLRRAAAAAGNAELVNLWAGTGYRDSTAEPAAAILTRLAGAG